MNDDGSKKGRRHTGGLLGSMARSPLALVARLLSLVAPRYSQAPAGSAGAQPEAQDTAVKGYYPQSRAEHLIALGRMVLSAFFLLAIYLDPSEPTRYAATTYGILLLYLVYSLFLGRVTWRKPFLQGHLQLVTHGIDLTVFAILMFLTAGPNSPFFVYFIFLLVCATLRWQWRGTLWTAVAALTVVVVLACYPANLLLDQDFELNRFIIRTVYLAVVASLLGYLGAYQQARHNVLSALADWPSSQPDKLQPMLCQVLQHAAEVLDVPRLLLVWEEEEEPWLHLALWSEQQLHYSCEPPDTFETVVTEQVAGSSFFCHNAGDLRSVVVLKSPDGLLKWQGCPLNGRLQERYDVRSLLASQLQGERVAGHLLALDKKVLSADDLVLGEIVAHEVAARLDHMLLLKQLQTAAAAEERVRLARDLHDGLLQSLTGVALQLESAQRQMENEPQKARQLIQEVQRLLSAEQRDLRSHITDLRPYLPGRPSEDFRLPSRLAQLAQDIRRQWGLSVQITTVPAAPPLARNMAREIYLVVHEALYNAVRHAGATALRAELSFHRDQVHIMVADNGRGFSFRGRYDQQALSELNRGPVTLKERIAALEGTLSIDSQETGARLDINLPLSL